MLNWDIAAIKRGSRVWVLVASAVLGMPNFASADSTTYASGERNSVALGHYARARTMLVEALAEFEQARKMARPDMLLDPEEWRTSIISRTEELNRVLDPKPRVTRAGVRFRANNLLIRRERQRTPSVEDGAKDSNIYGESSKRAEMRAKRAQDAMAEDGLDDASGDVKVVASEVEKAKSALPSREEQEQAARELSFSESNVKQAGVLKPDAEPAQAPADSAAARGALKPSKTIVPNEEEVITTKRADVLAEAGAKAGTPGQVESRPGAGEPPVDDVEAAVEKAIQDKLKAERDSEAGVLGNETSGE